MSSTSAELASTQAVSPLLNADGIASPSPDSTDDVKETGGAPFPVAPPSVSEP
jgi:hypothetical protein